MDRGREGEPPQGGVEAFLGEPTRDLSHWRWLWAGDHRFPITSGRGLLGRVTVGLRKLLRPLVKAPVADLFDRQRTFDLVLLEHLEAERGATRQRFERLEERASRLEERVEHFHAQVREHVEAIAETVERLEGYRVEGLDDVLKHNDALFALLDQKLDRTRREGRDLWGRMGSALARLEGAADAGLAPEEVAAAARARGEQTYLELERRHRGPEEKIEGRLERYLPYLEGRGPVLDLGCGRGEALELLGRRGIAARGVDSSAEMVEICREKGLEVEEGDLFAVLEAAEEGSLGAVVSFHVVEHLPPAAVDRLVRLAWGALRRDGALILETPNPTSLVVSGRNFWLDPTHRRPVHPESLQLLLRLAGFEPVERLDLRPFPEEERLPRVAVGEGAPAEVRELGRRVDGLRDALDDLLYGHQDYAVVGFKG